MADSRELTFSLNLVDDLSEAELAELRWHLGLAPEPQELLIWPQLSPVTAVYQDEDGNFVADPPYAIFAGRGAGQHIEGALVSDLVRRESRNGNGWALTTRQEIHPDDAYNVEALLVWLSARTDLPCVDCKAGNCSVGCELFAGFLRFYEDSDIEARLIFKGGRIGWSRRPGGFNPIEPAHEQWE